MVHPQHQRQGIGGSLMQTIESMFPEASKFELFTGNRSEGNIRLYASPTNNFCALRPGMRTGAEIMANPFLERIASGKPEAAAHVEC